jgi:hypothetical protein
VEAEERHEESKALTRRESEDLGATNGAVEQGMEG